MPKTLTPSDDHSTRTFHEPARFTVDGDWSLEQHLADVCGEVADGVSRLIPESTLEGLFLGGGYGRGEGGVRTSTDGDRPYNDLEFYVFVRGSTLLAEWLYRKKLVQLGHELEPFAGIEVEFKIVSRKTIERSKTTMFFYDLVSGHRCILGSSKLFGNCERQRHSVSIPLDEATRLLMNRCSGLLFAKERLEREEFSADDGDFVGRNLAKAELAFGDVVLAAHGLYHHSVSERAERIAQIRPTTAVPCLDAIVQLHRRGTQFKLHPVRATEPQRALLKRWEAISEVGRELFLWLENRRLGTAFPTVEAYATSPNNKCPETAGWRNALVNIKAFGAKALREQPLDYPRRRLLEALPILLWTPGAEANPQFSTHLARRLQRRCPDFASAVSAYAQLWHRFQ